MLRHVGKTVHEWLAGWRLRRVFGLDHDGRARIIRPAHGIASARSPGGTMASAA
jgi:hypothetical protein